MSNESQSSSSVITDGGVAAKHPPRPIHAALVGPSSNGEFNAIEEDFAPDACVRFDDVRFEFDSSFIGPNVSTELKHLSQMIKEMPGRPASIFGHADPIGDDDYNKVLSGRRAQVIYALLTRKTELWEEIYKSPLPGGDNWGIMSIQVMLKHLGHYNGPINGMLDGDTQAAVRAFQGSPAGAGLTVDGDPGPKTRAKLFRAYMDAICVSKDDQLQLDPTQDFLAQGADPGGKGDFQGCSEFNPDLVFSKSENAAFQAAPDKTQRNQENKPNRRVVIYLFRQGSKISPEMWPCPRAKEGVAGCKHRFFADGEKRRSPQDERRLYKDTKDTFACRFYDRIGVLSPCEAPPPPPTATAKLEIVFDQNNNMIVDASDPVTAFSRVGLWDHAFSATTGNLLNNAAEATNFIGSDSRRFYFRVEDSAASGEVTVRWQTSFEGGGDDDKPASQDITLTETGAGTKVFVSRAVFLVTDDVDRAQATNSGLPAGHPQAGNRNQGQSNHRLRRITVNDAHHLDNTVVAEYTPAGGGPLIVSTVRLFNRAPEERRLMRVHLVNVRDSVGGTGVLTAARRTLVTNNFRSIYATCGIFVEVDEIVIDPPASCIGWTTRYPTDPLAVDPSVESQSFPGGVNLIPSASERDLINVVRALPSFDANDIYLVFVNRIFNNPVPAPPGPGLQRGPRGESFPDSWVPANSIARSFAFVGLQNAPTDFTEVHETTHITTNLRNSEGGHFKIDPAGSPRGPIEGKNLMFSGTVDSLGIANTKRLWNERFTNNTINPAVIPPQIDTIRASRFIRPLP